MATTAKTQELLEHERRFWDAMRNKDGEAASEMTKPRKRQSRLSTSVSSHRFCVAGDPSTELYAVMMDRAPALRTADSNGGKCNSSSCLTLRSIG